MQLGPGRLKFALRPTSRRGTFRLGVSYRDTPSSWAAPQKDRDAAAEPPRAAPKAAKRR
ncbi:MAG: hypothetical protein K8W52_13035 [Deltaproteobacteria bacterium]|nr:hypothetical protein [Deltaproteobacteria bacterium]